MATLPIVNANSKRRKEKRWEVFARANFKYIQGAATSYVFPTEIKATSISGVDVTVCDTPNEAWVLHLETQSFKEAKQKVVSLSGYLGINNVKLVRVVDLTTELNPVD